jgi:Holliday junction resolvasome RuvABC endonuclease subunit
MIIAGLDISLVSPGVVKFVLDDSDLSIDNIDWIGFTEVKKIAELYPNNLFYYKMGKSGLNTYLDRSEFICNEITTFLNGVDCVAIEDYSFGSVGKSFHIGEFTGLIKRTFYNQYVPIRLYGIKEIKKFGAGNGNADKIMMGDKFKELNTSRYPVDKRDIFAYELSALDDYKSPKADVVDAYYITEFLLMELKLRRGLIDLKNLSEKRIEVFNSTTKTNPENLLCRPFLAKAK